MKGPSQVDFEETQTIHCHSLLCSPMNLLFYFSFLKAISLQHLSLLLLVISCFKNCIPFQIIFFSKEQTGFYFFTPEFFFFFFSLQFHTFDIWKFLGYGFIVAAAVSLHHGYGNAKSECICDLHHSFRIEWVFNPLSEARIKQ